MATNFVSNIISDNNINSNNKHLYCSSQQIKNNYSNDRHLHELHKLLIENNLLINNTNCNCYNNKIDHNTVNNNKIDSNHNYIYKNKIDQNNIDNNTICTCKWPSTITICGIGSLLLIDSAKRTFLTLQNFRIGIVKDFLRCFNLVAISSLKFANLNENKIASLSAVYYKDISQNVYNNILQNLSQNYCDNSCNNSCDNNNNRSGMICSVFDIPLTVDNWNAFLMREHPYEFRFVNVYTCNNNNNNNCNCNNINQNNNCKVVKALICCQSTDDVYKKLRYKNEVEYEEKVKKIYSGKLWYHTKEEELYLKLKNSNRNDGYNNNNNNKEDLCCKCFRNDDEMTRRTSKCNCGCNCFSTSTFSEVTTVITTLNKEEELLNELSTIRKEEKEEEHIPIKPITRYLEVCLKGAKSLGTVCLKNFLETTLLADGKTNLKEYLRKSEVELYKQYVVEN